MVSSVLFLTMHHSHGFYLGTCCHHHHHQTHARMHGYADAQRTSVCTAVLPRCKQRAHVGMLWWQATARWPVCRMYSLHTLGPRGQPDLDTTCAHSTPSSPLRAAHTFSSRHGHGRHRHRHATPLYYFKRLFGFGITHRPCVCRARKDRRGTTNAARSPGKLL